MTQNTFSKAYWGTVDGAGNFTPYYNTVGSNAVISVTEKDGDQTFKIDTNPDPSIQTREVLNYYNSTNTPTTWDVTYVGHRSNGDIVILNYGQYYLLTNDTINSSVQYLQEDFVFCFLKGTQIKTSAGNTPVERLNIGDELLSIDGRQVRIKWIGRQTRNPLFAKISGDLPVHISAGALGDGLPVRDLFVSPDHALLVDGCLVHASALVNGCSIVQVSEWHGDLEYFHIETEHHEIILAEGAPAETFIDNVSREKFDNYAEYAALYPNAKPMVELDLPRVKFERQLPMAIKRRLAAVADELEARAAKAA